MTHKVFFSFHYVPDNWRVATIRSIGAIEGNKVATDNSWESIKQSGDLAIKRWIDNEMNGRSCTIVLIGEKTYSRKYVKYEIEKSVEKGKGILGIYIHNLKNSEGYQSKKGENPFLHTNLGIADILSIKTYDPSYTNSQDVYAYIKDNIEDWIEYSLQNRLR